MQSLTQAKHYPRLVQFMIQVQRQPQIYVSKFFHLPFTVLFSEQHGFYLIGLHFIMISPRDSTVSRGLLIIYQSAYNYDELNKLYSTDIFAFFQIIYTLHGGFLLLYEFLNMAFLLFHFLVQAYSGNQRHSNLLGQRSERFS